HDKTGVVSNAKDNFGADGTSALLAGAHPELGGFRHQHGRVCSLQEHCCSSDVLGQKNTEAERCFTRYTTQPLSTGAGDGCTRQWSMVYSVTQRGLGGVRRYG